MSRTSSNPLLQALLPAFESAAQQFRVLGDPARLCILHAVCQSERCVNDIMQVTGLAQANVSRHLARLHQAGLLVRRREGTRVFYRAAQSSPLALCRLITQQVMVGQPSLAPGCGINQPTSVFPVESKEVSSV